jgi:hypothetical protein
MGIGGRWPRTRADPVLSRYDAGYGRLSTLLGSFISMFR